MRALHITAWIAACVPPSPHGPPASEPADDTSPDSDDEPSDTPPDTDPPAPPQPLRLGPEVVCADPSARTSLGELTAPLDTGAWGAQHVPLVTPDVYAGGGLAVGDVDGDGRLDILLPGRRDGQLFLQPSPRQFVDASRSLPPPIGEQATGAAFADADADGDLDVLIAGFTQADQYWINDGAGGFSDATADAGMVRDPALHMTSPAFADIDRDGDLDAFIAGSGPFDLSARISGDPSILYLNHGDGTFTDGSPLLPPELHVGYTFVAAWFDLDRDGWLDLYAVNDFGHVFPNTLIWNRQGTFVPDANAVGLDVALQGMGLAIGDIDGDGGTDLAMPGWGDNRLMAEAEGAWFDQATSRGMFPDPTRDQVIGWATVMADIDHDLDLDLIEGFGHILNQPAPADQPDEIFRNDGSTFTPVGQDLGFDHPGQTRAVLAMDIDGDGWLDLLRRDLTGPATLQFGRCGPEAWLVVRLHEPDSKNLTALGARVEVDVGGRTLWRHVHAGGTSVMAGGPPDVHFGLAQADRVVLRVIWPDGEVSEWSDVPTRRFVDVDRRAP